MTKHEIDTLHKIQLTVSEITHTLNTIKSNNSDIAVLPLMPITMNSLLKQLGIITLALDSLSNLPMIL